MTYETLDYQVEDGVLTLTLNRPDRMNAFNGQMRRDLIAAFDAADADDAVRVVIMTGAGRAFCAGADLSKGDATWEGHEEALAQTNRGDGGGELSRRIFRSLKPVIVAFNGPAVGMGMTVPLAADIRIAAKGVKMGFVFAARGIVPEGCSSWFLPRIVGISKALEWCYSARIFPSEEALAAGLLRSVHEKEDLIPAARALAREFIDNSSIPVINALSNTNHPCQALSDIQTIIEEKKTLRNLKITWIGDSNNVLNDFMFAALKLGADFSLACPNKYSPKKQVLKVADEIMAENNSTFSIMTDPIKAVKDSDVVVTDRIISMGDKNKESKKKVFLPKYRVTEKIMSNAKDDAIFMHCLPAVRGEEVSEKVIDGKNSVIWQQVENKLHMHKALIWSMLK